MLILALLLHKMALTLEKRNSPMGHLQMLLDIESFWKLLELTTVANRSAMTAPTTTVKPHFLRLRGASPRPSPVAVGPPTSPFVFSIESDRILNQTMKWLERLVTDQNFEVWDGVLNEINEGFNWDGVAKKMPTWKN